MPLSPLAARYLPAALCAGAAAAAVAAGCSAAASALAAAAAYAAAFLGCLAVADADLGLLACSATPESAFRGKSVLIVGASQGLGAALAKHLSKQGAKLILAARSEHALQELAAQCEGPCADAHLVLPLDVTASASDVEAFAGLADGAYDGLDYVFLAAGASQSAVVEETTMDVASRMVALNTLGSIAVARALLPHMLRRRRGRFVPVLSMAAKVASPGQAMYSATKQALYGYFASLAAEVADRGVSVSMVCPGPIAGEGTKEGGAERSVFGAEGMVMRVDETAAKKKVSMARCVELICCAAAHGRFEAWIAKHPVLLAGYVSQYAPGLAKKLLQKVGPKRARALKAGKSGYDFSTTDKKAT